MKKKVCMTVVLTFGFLLSAFSQLQIKGKITNSNGEPIPAVNLILKTNDGLVLNFGSSSKIGLFNLTFPNSTTDTIILTVTAVGLKNQRIILDKKNIKPNYDLVMIEEQFKIKTVDIISRPKITSNGDTLNYTTAHFTSSEDRTIADVIRKMPGIKIEDDGKIKYNGKAISNFYIDGDNMLNDRYNVGTKIPHGAVEKVQVIEKDQPIKLLRQNNMSDDVAINLVIKDEAKLDIIKEVRAGIGIPKKFEANFIAMSLGKKFKFINNATANNIGIDPRIEIQAHGNNKYANENNKPQELLSTGTGGSPPLPQSRYLFNTSALANLNNYYRINNDLTAKFNFSYLYQHETQQMDVSSHTYLSNGETFSYEETQLNKTNIQKIHSELDLTGNTDSYFFNNTLIASFDPKQVNSGIAINLKDADQILKQQTFDISNELNYIKKMKSSHTVNFHSYLNLTSQPESLSINRGLNDSLLNNGIPYASLIQQVETPTFFTNNYVTYGLRTGRFKQNYKVGVSTQDQQLISNLYREQYDESKQLINTMTNDIEWFKRKVYAEGSYEYTGNKIRASLIVPVGFNKISYLDLDKKLDTSLNRVFVDPSVKVDYRIGTENEIAANYNFNNKLGGIEEVYKGIILKNYRSLYANDAPVSEQKSHHVNATFRFKQSLNMLFFNLSVSYDHTSFNTISSFQVDKNLQQKIILAMKNRNSVLSFNANGSKYLPPIQSTFNVSANYEIKRFTQLQNGLVENFNTSTVSYAAGIESKLTNFLSWSYLGNYSITNSIPRIDTQVKINPKQLTQRSGLTANYFKNLFITLSAEHCFTQQARQPNLNFIFSDFSSRFVFVKIKTDLQVGLTNLTNIKKFGTIDFSPNAMKLSNYRLPGRQMMIKTTFNF